MSTPKPPRYAAQTNIPVATTKAHIEALLTKHGATAVAMGWDQAVASVMFDLHGRRIRMDLQTPDPFVREFTHSPTGRRRTAAQAQAAYDQAHRQRWRALWLIIRAKLEAIEAQIVTPDQEFGMYVLIPGSAETVGQHITQELDRATTKVGYRPLLELTTGGSK